MAIIPIILLGVLLVWTLRSANHHAETLKNSEEEK